MHLNHLCNLAAALAVLALGSAPTPAINLLVNGDFAQATPAGQPLQWKLDASGNIKMTVVPKDGRELGTNALHVVDKSSYGAGLGPALMRSASKSRTSTTPWWRTPGWSRSTP